MRLSSALGRLCVLYFLVAAEKGQSKAAANLSSYSSSSVIHEETTTTTMTNGSDCDTASEDVAVVVVRRLMEMVDLQQQISATEETFCPPSPIEEGGGGGGSSTQRLALVLWSLLGERDHLKQKKKEAEDEVTMLKEELLLQMGRHHPHPHWHDDDDDDDNDRHDHRHLHVGSPKDDTCPCVHEMTKALSQFQNQQKKLLREELAGLEESISFMERDLNMIINGNKMQQEEEEQKHKIIVKNDTETKGNTEDEEESVVASDCYELFELGKKESGVYTIYPQGDDSEGVSVWCDMGGSYGGSTVILLRKHLPQQVNFTRGWQDYKKGFGHPESEYWIGNEVLHHLTSSSKGKPQQALQLEMTDWDNLTKEASYGKFSVGGEEDNFRLDVGLFDSSRSTVKGDSLSYNVGMMFTTIDKDNDIYSGANCVEVYGGGGGFWYHNCGRAFPTGPLLPKGKSLHALVWYDFNNDWTHLKTLTMKIHPYSG